MNVGNCKNLSGNPKGFSRETSGVEACTGLGSAGYPRLSAISGRTGLGVKSWEPCTVGVNHMQQLIKKAKAWYLI